MAQRIGILRGTYKGKVGTVVRRSSFFTVVHIEGIRGDPAIRNRDIIWLRDGYLSKEERKKLPVHD